MSDLVETFSIDAPGTLLTAHTGDSGQLYLRDTSTSRDSVVSDAGRLRLVGLSGYSLHYPVQGDGVTAWPITGRESTWEWDYVKKSAILGGGPAFITGDAGERYLVGHDGTTLYLYSVSNVPSFTTLTTLSKTLTTDVAKRFRFRCGGRLTVEEWNGSAYVEILSYNYVSATASAAIPSIPAFFFDNFGSGMSDSTGIHLDNANLTNPATIRPTDIQIVCHGNSRTEGSGVTTTSKWVWGVANSLSGGMVTGSSHFCINRGHAGWTTAQLTSDYPSEVRPLYNSGYGGNVLVFEEIINSLLGGGRNDTQTISDVEAYIAQAQADGWAVVLVTCIAWSTASGTKETQRLAVNAYFVANATTLGIQVADVGALAEFSSPAAAANATYYGDGVHATAAGHALYVAPVVAAIQAALAGPTPRVRVSLLHGRFFAREII